MDPQPYVHLHVHSHYSILDGACKIPDLVKKANEFGMPAVALTDHGNLFGAIELCQEAKKSGVKPILGYEAYVAPESRFVKSGGAGNYNHLTLLVKNETGYRNLLKIASEAYVNGFYYKPRIDKEFLAAHANGLVCLSGCLKGELCQAILAGGEKRGPLEVAAAYRDMFEPGDFYVELQYNGIDAQARALDGLLPIAADLSLPTVVTNDVHYLTRDAACHHDVLLCIQTGKTLTAPGRLRFATEEFYFKSPAEMVESFRDHRKALARSLEVAEKCNLDIPFGRNHLPPFSPPEGESQEAYFDRLCREGLARRFGKDWNRKAEVRERYQKEAAVVKKMGFVGYFLIVQDFIRHARGRGIPVGPGRGSSAGSIVAYALEITNIDPLRHGLLFERFLNEGRNEMPDIDIDFAAEGRSEVIEYVRRKYGAENVCQIVTFSKMAARAAIRDVGRVMEIPLSKVDRIAKKVPERPGITLAEALEEDAEFREMVVTDEEAKSILESSRRIEGLVRQPGTHPAGIIISDRPITEYCPLYRNGDDITTQYSMKHVEKIGLLKMDFLGLDTLSHLARAVELVRETRGETIDLAKIPLDDAKTYELLSRGDTPGLFQVEGDGMRELLRKLRPERFDDIVPLVALFRPGPLQSGMVETYIRVKHGQEKASYRHPRLQPILEETHGVILYQEQVMRIAADLAGFSLTEADHLRKAMGKKDDAIMAQFKKKFIDGAVAGGVDETTAAEIFELIRYFAGYGFNKCLPGSARVTDCATGRMRTLAELAARPAGEPLPEVPSLENGRIVPRRPAALHDNGEKQVFRLVTRSGRTLRATGNHPLLTPAGWKPLDALAPGVRIAVPRRIPYVPSASAPPSVLEGMGRTLARDPLAPFPEILFRLPPEEVAEALSPLWGGLPPGDPEGPAAVWTPSESRARDLVHLLLRQDIPAEMEEVPAGVRGTCPYHAVRPAAAQVPAAVGRALSGGGELPPPPSYRRHSSCEARIVPAAPSPSGMRNERLEVSYSGDVPEDDELEVLWDPIREIRPDGFERTYDLEVPGPANFVADDVVVHNSHSAAYALVTYQSAYLKANYPTEFMAALLTTVREDSKKVSKYVEETVRTGIPVLAPSIDRSQAHFAVEEGKIRYGMEAIKGVGLRAVESILAAREKLGTFPASVQGLFDLAANVDLGLVNKKVLECLVKAGALDCFGLARAQVMALVEKALRTGHDQQKNRSRGQRTLFDSPGESGSKGNSGGPAADLPVPDVPEWPARDRLAYEKETLGFYFSGHPLEDRRATIETFSTARAADLAQLGPGCEVTIGGMITSVHTTLIKRGRFAGEKMARFAFEDLTGSCPVVVFSEKYKETKDLIVPDSAVFVRGRIDESTTQVSVLAEEIFPLEAAEERLSRSLTVTVRGANEREVATRLQSLRQLAREHSGSVPLFLAIETSGTTVMVRAGRDFSVQPSQEFTRSVSELLGSGALNFR
ncbi:MAG: DNA polymerase III subunit alpha [Planctomycetes bacterium]|nr:DNA polymerase III subunit alpha [Planctomycetota bacterium]